MPIRLGGVAMIVRPVTFYSSALNRRCVCYVGLPDHYDADESKRYPVIYLLHGKTGMETDWLYKGNAEQIIQEMWDKNQLREAIIVMPNDGGHSDGTFYVDWYDGSGNFEQYMIYDLVPMIDAEFRTYPSRLSRVIGGLSMGGYGAVMLALKNPSLFGAAVSFSGALGDILSLTGGEQHLYMASAFAPILGPAHGEHAQQYRLKNLALHRIEENNGPALYINCGKQDYLYEANIGFTNYLRKIGYNHQYEEFEGEHNWDYWQENLSRGLAFFESYFEKQRKE